MKNLRKKFTKDGFDHEQVLRSGDFAIYKRFHRTSELKSSNFELIRVLKAKKDHTFPNGATVLAGSEMYPSTKQWGSKGWTFPDLASAKKKLIKLTSVESIS